ncbi:hypothetical protein SESBI_14319 [Sesbania bispinosa]|nr:hypothetical protein SESBI_14319 [Sesbania bispinosa]
MQTKIQVNVGLESVVNITRFLFNPGIPEVFQMLEWLHRYNLKVETSNGNNVTYLLLGDDDVHRLLKVSCQELLSSMQDPHSETSPDL